MDAISIDGKAAWSLLPDAMSVLPTWRSGDHCHCHQLWASQQQGVALDGRMRNLEARRINHVGHVQIVAQYTAKHRTLKGDAKAPIRAERIGKHIEIRSGGQEDHRNIAGGLIGAQEEVDVWIVDGAGQFEKDNIRRCLPHCLPERIIETGAWERVQGMPPGSDLFTHCTHQ
jgi:hypothetical protein